MTRDEILKMPAGREMDALIAKMFFGWHKDGDFLVPPPEHPASVNNWAPNWLPNYSTNIAAAFEALYKWLDDNKTYAVHIETVNVESGRLHDVILWGLDEDETFDVRDKDLAVAIYRAALLATMNL